MQFPVAHFDGNYFADAQTLDRIEGEGQVVVRYCNSEGVCDERDSHSNPNGSARSIAGICNSSGNVVGMMPHPERSIAEIVGSVGGDRGLAVFEGVLSGQ